MKLNSIAKEARACRAACAHSKVGDLMQLLHHGQLAEVLSEPVENRISYILNYKPKEEQALRLRMLRPWPGVVPQPLAEAYTARDEARTAYDEARARDEALTAYHKAYTIYDEARNAYNKARTAARPELERQHRAAYPDSPWNGKTIFS